VDWGQTDKQADIHTHHNTLQPFRGRGEAITEVDVMLVTSRYIHCRWTMSSISTISPMSDKARSHLSTSCSNALTKRDAFIVDSFTWLSSNAWLISSVCLHKHNDKSTPLYRTTCLKRREHFFCKCTSCNNATCSFLLVRQLMTLLSCSSISFVTVLVRS